ncbi:hypothetical protein HIM_02767 [Hirsutella minnesotensis 3608]|nr:hypothetical protein HIM_02767 [Hirsutella minnesotensis 3608]
MPPKRKRATASIAAATTSSETPVEQQESTTSFGPVGPTRRATRQTPVLPPLPPTSTTTAGASSSFAASPSQASLQAPTASASSSGPSTIQTPVPIPTPGGHLKRTRHQALGQAAVPSVVGPEFNSQLAASAPRSLAPAATLVRRGSAAEDMAAASVSAAFRDSLRPSNLVAPEITYHVPQPPQPGRAPSSLVRPHGPTAPPPWLDSRPLPAVVTPVPPPKPALAQAPRQQQRQQPRHPPRADRNIDKVVLGNLCFRTWYPSHYGKEVLGDSSGNVKGGSKDHAGGGGGGGKASSRKDRDHPQPMLERLYVCPSCFKYAKELVAWRGHVRLCERRAHVPGTKIYIHPRGRRTVLVAQDAGKAPGTKRRRGDGGVRYVEEVVQDEGEWSIWEVDGEKDGLFCQNLSLFAKLFLDNKSVFFDVMGFNYFLLVYTPPPPAPPAPTPLEAADGQPSALPPTAPAPPPQITGFFSKEKMSWDNNNLACILVFPPWQRKGLGGLLMGASYEISRREGIMGGPEKPISDLGKKGYKRFWSSEIARWLLSLDTVAEGSEDEETIVDVDDVSRGTWISPDDCLAVLRDMGVLEDAGLGPGKPERAEADPGADVEMAARPSPEGGAADGPPEPAGSFKAQDGAASGTTAVGSSSSAPEPAKQLHRVRLDKAAVRRYVSTNGISLERTCDPRGFVEGYALKPAGDGAGEDAGDG